MKKTYKTPAIQVINLSVEDIMLAGSIGGNTLNITTTEIDGADAFDNRSPIWGDRK
ncbi:MAG: hypothetical protein RR386_07375 [Bacteroidaceae bacterium]